MGVGVERKLVAVVVSRTRVGLAQIRRKAVLLADVGRMCPMMPKNAVRWDLDAPEGAGKGAETGTVIARHPHERISGVYEQLFRGAARL